MTLAVPTSADQQPPASGRPATQPDGSQPAAGSQDANAQNGQQETPEQELARLKAELTTATGTRIPDLQRAIEAAQKERDDERKARNTAEARAGQVHQSWIEWAKENLPPDLWKQIEGHEQERTGKVLQTKAARVDALEAIIGAYEKGDTKFAAFLQRQDGIFRETGQGRITKEALPALRKMYDELTPSGGQQPAPTTPTTPSAPATPAAPPRVPSPGGPSQPGGEPAYKPGDNPTSMWAKVFPSRGKRPGRARDEQPAGSS